MRLFPLLVFCAVAATNAFSAEPLSVATYNVRFNHLRENPDNTWAVRKERVKALLEYYDFDLVGTQEPMPDQVEYLRAGLPRYEVISTSKGGAGTNDQACAIFYKTSRLKMLGSGSFWLSKTPEKPGSGRICTWGKFEDLLSKKIFYHFNTHLSAGSGGPREKAVAAREAQAKVMVAQIKAIAGDAGIFCTGDFNAQKTEGTIKTMLEGGFLSDSKARCLTPPYGPAATFNGFKTTFEAGEKEPRDEAIARQLPIDYIFISKGIKVLKYAVITDSYYWKFPSDHFPVTIKAAVE